MEKQKYYDRTRSYFHIDLRDDLYILLFTVLKILNDRIQLRNKFKWHEENIKHSKIHIIL